MLAVTRASEIWIGIGSATLVLASMDLGNARRRLASELAAIAAEISQEFGALLARTGVNQLDTRPARHALATRIVALSPLIDEVLGEVSDLRYRVGTLRAATEGLFVALSGWRTAANCLEELGEADQGCQSAAAIVEIYPALLRLPLAKSVWADHPDTLIGVCSAAARSLVALPVHTPSLRLLADGIAQALRGLSQTAEALTALVGATPPVSYRHRRPWYRPDLLPPAIAAVRVLVTLVAIELVWIATAWPNGAQAVCLSGEEPERARGLNVDTLWADELACWQRAQSTWDLAMLALRAGTNPQALITTTPRRVAVLSRILAEATTVKTTDSTYADQAQLPREFLNQIVSLYENPG